MPMPSQELEISRLTALPRNKVQQEKLPPFMIHDARMGSKLVDFEVEWDGWTNPIDFTWEPEVNMPGYADLVRDFIAEWKEAGKAWPPPRR
ncbi:hypothetical protein T492DRAFT_866738 [Pavlovales sp. CCMP2436]|nr:hypothetical protein T492DRAFT_866738 [Pavlovales sp. CCMP2436]